MIFFFKQKTAYEMRMSDWSSDVCSSDLQIAGLINDRKLPILADVRDESDAELRMVLEPRARTVEAEVLMESLFKLTELETRFGLNMNVLDQDRTPRVISLEIGRASFRARVCQYESIPVVAVSLNTTHA